MTTPLDGLKVLDLSRVLAGPWAGQLLGDYGADVVKVEKPLVGDDTRHWGPPWVENSITDSAYFHSANRNKRSITVDIATGAGQRLIVELAKGADVVIENYRVGTLERYGLDFATLAAVNPRLIYCSISAYGQEGSRAREPGYDAMIQASAGLMSITGAENSSVGESNAGPQKVGVAISDIMAGMYATTAILAALNARERDGKKKGKGQHIDIPLYDSQVAWLANQNMNYLIGGETPKRMGTAHPNLCPYQVFRTADSELMLAVGNDRQFASCCKVLGVDELSRDSRFASMSQRVANRETLVEKLQERFATKTTSSWLALFSRLGVPAGPVNDIATVLSNDHAQERNLVRNLTTASGSLVPTVSNPVAFGETPVCYDKAPPELGEQTDEVLSEWLGYSDAQLQQLHLDKVI